jgi:hypothetical protein
MVENNSQKPQGTYTLPVMVPFALCGAVLSIVLENNKEAIKLFEQVKENCKLPGEQERIRVY